MQLEVLIKVFTGKVVVTQLIYTTVGREITQFIIALWPNADKSRYITPNRSISNKCTLINT